MQTLKTQVSETIERLRQLLSKCEFVSPEWGVSVTAGPSSVALAFYRPTGKESLDPKDLAKSIGPNWKRQGWDWIHEPSDMPELRVRIMGAERAPNGQSIEL